MTDPSIPDASYVALFAYEEDRTRVTVEETIRRIAEPMIAAELRRLANLDYEARDAIGLIRRADELAPPEVDAADGLPVDHWRPTW